MPDDYRTTPSETVFLTVKPRIPIYTGKFHGAADYNRPSHSVPTNTWINRPVPVPNINHSPSNVAWCCQFIVPCQARNPIPHIFHNSISRFLQTHHQMNLQTWRTVSSVSWYSTVYSMPMPLIGICRVSFISAVNPSPRCNGSWNSKETPDAEFIIPSYYFRKFHEYCRTVPVSHKNI